MILYNPENWFQEFRNLSGNFEFEKVKKKYNLILNSADLQLDLNKKVNKYIFL